MLLWLACAVSALITYCEQEMTEMPPHTNIVELEATLRKHFETVLEASEPIVRENGNTRFAERGYCRVAEIFFGKTNSKLIDLLKVCACAEASYFCAMRRCSRNKVTHQSPCRTALPCFGAWSSRR